MRFQLSAAWLGLASIGFALLAPPANAQCLDWKDSFEFSAPGVTFSPNTSVRPVVNALLPFNDGTGPSLYVAGWFTNAGDVPANCIATWNGFWSSLPVVIPGTTRPNTMAVFDDGTGAALYVGSSTYNFPEGHILRWDGSTWSPVGSGVVGEVLAMAVMDDGTGPALYAAGGLLLAGAPASRVVKWDGTSWSTLGSGISGQTSGGDSDPVEVRSLAVFDDGNGPALYAGGHFSMAGGNPADCIAKWDGSSWSDVGGGMNGGSSRSVLALAVFDDGSGPQLYAGGSFSYSGGLVTNSVARWDGNAWSPVGAGLLGGQVSAFTGSTVGGAPALYAGGLFFPPSGGGFAHNLVMWDGVSWTGLGDELRTRQEGSPGHGEILALASFDEGSGPAVFAGGDFLFSDAGLALNGMARWDGNSWSRVGAATEQGSDASVRELVALDLGAGPEFYAAGSFGDAGGMSCQGIAQWTDASWSPLGNGAITDKNLTILALAAIGSSLYAGGHFNTLGGFIRRWDGSGWTTLGFGLDGAVRALVAHDDGGGTALYAGGDFVYSGPNIMGKLAKWNGSSWSNLGGMTDTVRTLASFDDGSGLALFAGGDFDYAGPTAANHIAKRIGFTWYALGSGTNGSIYATCIFDDGTGPALYVGGDFTTAGGVPANRIARWNGASWSAVGDGFDGRVLELAVHDDGNGPALYAGGEFGHSGAVVVPHLARWNGSTWKSMGSGTNDVVRAIASFDDGSGGGPDLWVGGDFTAAAGVASSHVGVWRGCPDTVSAMCYGDGTVAPCPCANQGVFRHGCENSANTGGARLYATGATIPDSLVLHAVGEMPTALTIFLQGNALVYETAAFGDGLRCAGGALKRLYVKSASGGTAVAPQAGDPSITARSAALGDSIPAGGTRYYQTYYRDSNPSFCPAPQGNTFNATNGIRVVW